MKNKADYLNYVYAVLHSIPEDAPIRGVYNTGFGLTLTHVDLGPETSAMSVVQNEIAKIRPPNQIKNTAEWLDAWDTAREIVDRFVENREPK